MIYNIPYKELLNEIIFVNSELPSKIVEKNSSFTDIVLRFRNIDFIIEMNYHEKDYTVEKNNSYLFNLHTSKVFNKNKYGKFLYTYLLNIDDYDILDKKDIIYESYLNYPKYNLCIYNNIKITHFNLAKLKSKLYNKVELNKLSELEKLFVIFVCQEKDFIRSIINCKEVEGVIKIMEKIVFDNALPTYDYEEFLRQERIGFEKKNKEFDLRYKDYLKKEKELTKEQEELSKEQEELSKEQEELSKEQEKHKNNIKEFNKEKFELAKKLIKLGLTKDEIKYITKLSSKELSII